MSDSEPTALEAMAAWCEEQAAHDYFDTTGLCARNSMRAAYLSAAAYARQLAAETPAVDERAAGWQAAIDHLRSYEPPPLGARGTLSLLDARAAEKRPGNTAWFNFYHGFVAGLSSCCNPALNHEVVNQEWEAYVAKGLKK